MLSWSSTETDERIDLTAVADGCDGVGLEHGDALLRFASACAGDDDAQLAAARDALVGETDEAFMIDAAAVAANFEMMTRLADGTGSSMPQDRLDRSATEIATMRIAGVPSHRVGLPVLVIDGDRFDDLAGLADEWSRHLDGHRWKGNLDAFNDILRGGFGTPEGGFVLRWLSADRSRHLLGATLFDTIVEIIRMHGPGGDEAEDGVVLDLC